MTPDTPDTYNAYYVQDNYQGMVCVLALHHGPWCSYNRELSLILIV